MKKYLLGSSLLLASFISPSFAEESNDFYLKIGGGLTFPSDVETKETVDGTVYDTTFETDNSGIFSAGIGKEFYGYRLEFEYSKTQLASDEVTSKTGGIGISSSWMNPFFSSFAKSVLAVSSGSTASATAAPNIS